MYKFSTVLVGPEALEIRFAKPHAAEILEDIKAVLESMGAVFESAHHNSYTGEDFCWYAAPQGRFTLTDFYGDYSIYAQGDNAMIAQVEKALLASGKFEKE